MEEYSHFILGSNFASHHDAFLPKTPIIEGLPIPERDRNTHYSMIKESYDNVVFSEMEVLRQFQQENQVSADGVYLDVNLATGRNSLKSLDSKSTVKLMNVTAVDNGEEQPLSTKATIYLPTSQQDWLDKKLDKYIDPTQDSSTGRPNSYSLINDINSIQSSSLESFFSNRIEYSSILPNEKNWYEIWVANYSDDVIFNTYNKIRNLGIEISEKNIPFKQTVVFLIHADLNELEKLPYALNYLSEIRVSKQPLLLTGDPIEHQEWTDQLFHSINFNIDDNAPVIGIIDTGVNKHIHLFKHVCQTTVPIV